jgi:hypothetical protein
MMRWIGADVSMVPTHEDLIKREHIPLPKQSLHLVNTPIVYHPFIFSLFFIFQTKFVALLSRLGQFTGS